MKNIIVVIIAISVLGPFIACNNSNSENDKKELKTLNEKIDKETIQVYYFHGSIRCNTCVSVDEDTYMYLNELFPEKVNAKKIIFKSINIDKNERKDLIEKFEIYGQTLLFIKGNKVINKTDDAFMLVTSNPNKWKQIVNQTINDLIN